jgi:flavodoxin
MTRTLVAFFSATGTTARTAKALAHAADADLFEIRPATPYSSADLNWNNKRSRSSVEMDDESARPELADAGSVDGYDTIFVGFPVWWYVEPRIIDTFLEAHDFSGKTIVPFATSGGSGLGRAPQRFRSICPGATVKDGKRLSAGESAASLAGWMHELGL